MESSKSTYIRTWLILTVIISFLTSFFYTPHSGKEVGFFLRLFAAILGIPTGFIGFLIGDFIRNLTVPDAIFTTGGVWSILKQKIFWFCVPQLIGTIIGAAMIIGLILPK